MGIWAGCCPCWGSRGPLTVASHTDWESFVEDSGTSRRDVKLSKGVLKGAC